jgi:hypothetical protein
VPGGASAQVQHFALESAQGLRHGNEQPALVVNDVKSGANAKGAVALWLGPGTIAHFRDLTIRPSDSR